MKRKTSRKRNEEEEEIRFENANKKKKKKYVPSPEEIYVIAWRNKVEIQKIRTENVLDDKHNIEFQKEEWYNNEMKCRYSISCKYNRQYSDINENTAAVIKFDTLKKSDDLYGLNYILQEEEHDKNDTSHHSRKRANCYKYTMDQGIDSNGLRYWKWNISKMVDEGTILHFSGNMIVRDSTKPTKPAVFVRPAPPVLSKSKTSSPAAKRHAQHHGFLQRRTLKR